ncbi:protein SCAI [Biomphalaria glabrata]|uniref:Protein SCAI-like n=2 Tax=Biomphalaria TaxID=6525 RepID=A0A2C9JH12_BIOGL|nr:protein SCAI-like [Biomphalaria glabrata]KAI8730060.1 protein SCAI-like [Biomphalaria glabrata]KAI8750598.1 protein SCAI [Biomphalaria glabrata]KAK0053770.1 protein SCAI [Biomphalaria pfeifferi]
MASEVQNLDENEKKIVNEFCHHLEKSKQLFNGLRDLPQYGHKQWQSYFGRTFDVYTKLWKFQQQHRAILDSKYGLKRWQIGEIASKIGQLYYHYYLRTSETNYLNESFSFYSAIRMRAYYSKASKEERPDLMVKKLRYYARFIVVCLLLKKMKLVRDLVRELAKQIDDYTGTYEPEDQMEWNLVLGEIKAFIEADNLINVVDVDSSSIVLSHRLTPLNTPPLEKGTPVYLTLQEVLIVGNCHEQVKFSELTLDMFRMLQSLEREPQDDLSNQIYDNSPAPGRTPFENGDRTNKRDNPHKYLLYKPTYGQLNTFLASAFKELPPNGAMVLYISADGCPGNQKHTDDAAYDLGGVITNSRKEGESQPKGKKGEFYKEMHCLHPGDLYPYTRKPLFLIIDSSNSSAFQNFPNLFGQPLVCLLSPEQVPVTMQDQQLKGNLFTLFLHCPLMAMCCVCNIGNIPVTLWDKCQTQVDKFVADASKLFSRARKLDHAYVQFLGDDFLRLLLLRFVFCYIVLILHRGFKGPSYYPASHPALPTDEILEHPTLYKLVLDLATMLEVRSLFAEPGDVDISA